MADSKAITKRADDFSAWYTDLIMKAELADYSPVRGCMVIRPNGYAIWEQMKRALYDMFKATGHQNAYFPLFIPQSFLSKEAEHVEGFAPELAVVTHGGGKELEEPLVVRPTSETIIYSMFSKWIQSHRDLPLLINQWANAVRWEMRTRLFLRTTEFLWQEGHTAHATEAEAEVEMLMILGLYRRFMEEWMAMPVVTGRKTDSERFAGALRTYSCEALMQDNKALQAGTSHNLGQNFAKAFDVTYQTAEGGLDHVWNTSWGVSTRLIGGLIMTHGDDNGMICPPRLAQWQVVIVPIWKTDDEKNTIFAAVDTLSKDLQAAGIRVTADRREGMKPGAKYYEWEARGVPFRLEMGPRDIAAGTVMLARRTGGGKEAVPLEGLGARLQDEIVAMQKALLDAAIARREAASLRGPKSKQEFIDFIEKNGGFVYAGWCGDPAVEAEIKEQTKATIRCLPDAEFRSAGGPDHLYLDWTSCHGRGCVGASVLTPVEADAGLSRDLSGELLMSGVPLAAIADAVGTPAWCYNAPVIRERFAALEAAFDGLPHRIDYAVKANSNLAILRLLAKLGAGADIVSGGELLRALAAGFKPAHIVFSGVGKTDEELVAAMTCGVGQINVESISELHRLAVLSDAREGSVNIGIRLNPDVTVETHPYISTGKGGLKFGIPIDQLDEALAIFEEAPGLLLSGLAVHIGSQLLDPAPYVAAIDRLQRELDRVRAAGHRPTVLDLGGGLGIMYREETPLDPVSWMAPLREAMIRSECEIHIEPGRYLVGSAGVLLTRVVHRKYAGGREMVIVDAAMNDLIRPALYKAWHEIVAVEGGATAPVSTDIVGPVCETGDFFALDRPLPLVQPGAHLAILGAGAYGFTMSSNYNSRARAAEVLVEDGKWAVVRPRERLTDLFKDEVPDPFAAESRDPS